jgi:hypothetical protein
MVLPQEHWNDGGRGARAFRAKVDAFAAGEIGTTKQSRFHASRDSIA